MTQILLLLSMVSSLVSAANANPNLSPALRQEVLVIAQAATQIANQYQSQVAVSTPSNNGFVSYAQTTEAQNSGIGQNIADNGVLITPSYFQLHPNCLDPFTAKQNPTICK